MKIEVPHCKECEELFVSILSFSKISKTLRRFPLDQPPIGFFAMFCPFCGSDMEVVEITSEPIINTMRGLDI